MRSLLKDRSKALYVAIIVAIFIGSFFLRTYRLTSPSEKVFDEVYFPVFANDYLTKTDFYDAHPPLGKLAIAVSVAAFGNNPLGWRFMNALAGMGLLIVIMGFTYELTKRWQTAMLALFLVAIDPMALVESRVGLINIYLAFFTILGLWFFWRWYTTNKWYTMVIALISFAAAAAVKWIGIGAFAAAFLFWFIDLILQKKIKIKSSWRTFLAIMIFALIIMPLVYISTFIPDILRGQDFFWWHTSSFNYHAHLTSSHPYGADWWTWPIMWRPIWLYYKSLDAGVVQGIFEPGNLVTWIGGLFALVVMIFGLRSKVNRSRNLFLILCYLTLYLPWILIHRVKFIYHYFDPVLILLIILAIVLDEKVFSDKKLVWAGILFLTLGYAFFIYFLPILIGFPVTYDFYHQHMWLKNWI